uniref:Cytochrome b n=1 Tax=Paralongidorus litoralis TaxID=474435 RepID=A0A1P8C769_9BILA|nr:cytochrome b [Paralongidorus litoralis]AOT84242.1 cytochrome b [Paralongidorus litoralis]
MTLTLLKSNMSAVWNLATPMTATYLWGLGSFLGIMMTVQVMSGFVLAMYYVGGTMAWDSVVEITREVSSGWLLRLIHGNSASFVFLVLYLHFFRGVAQSSFYLHKPWLSGWVIMALTMASAFLGYVLPWGQMSFWGATVIINLISVMPMGKQLVVWLWGGFYVSSFTCSFFYALHFLLPFLVLGMAVVHLLLLHETGSSTKMGTNPVLKMKFTHLFSYKDAVNLTLLWGLFVWALVAPDWSADPVNFSASDLSSSPIHIQPELYFLHLYAVLRSIPNKVGGLIGFALAFTILICLAMVNSTQALSQISIVDMLAWSFLVVNIMLMWLGSKPVESPFIFMGQGLTILYFAYVLTVILMDNLICLYL